MAENEESPWWSTLTYTSRKRLRVYSPLLALVYYALFVGLLLYVFVYTVGLKKGYQDYDQLTASTTTKVKGTTSIGSGFSAVVFDDKDLVVPPLQPDSVFIITSFARTPNQTRGICEGTSTSNDNNGELCNCSFAQTVQECCADGVHTYNGLKLGECGPSGVFCNLNTWCPVEPKVLTLTQLDVSNWTIFFRVDVRFPKFNLGVTNVHAGDPGPILGDNLFSVGDVLSATNTNYSSIQTTGVIIGAYFQYDCDLNEGTSGCRPNVTFKRLDPSTGTSTGFNYRYVDHSDSEGVAKRDLYKVYGVRIVIQVAGRGGQFDFFILSTTLGSGLALLGLAAVVTDLIMTNLLPQKDHFFEKVEAKQSGRWFPCFRSSDEKEPVELQKMSSNDATESS